MTCGRREREREEDEGEEEVERRGRTNESQREMGEERRTDRLIYRQKDQYHHLPKIIITKHTHIRMRSKGKINKQINPPRSDLAPEGSHIST